jgi:hypothetical protein
MVEVKLGRHQVDLPFTVRLYDVTEKLFDELVDEDTRAELIDGVMVVHSPASPRHNAIAGFLRALTQCYVEEKGLGNVLGPDSLIRLRSRQKFAPDLFFLEQKRVPKRLPKKQFEGAPDLLVEVLSPSNRRFDLEEKRPAYQKSRSQGDLAGGPGKGTYARRPAPQESLCLRHRRGRPVGLGGHPWLLDRGRLAVGRTATEGAELSPDDPRGRREAGMIDLLQNH